MRRSRVRTEIVTGSNEDFCSAPLSARGSFLQHRQGRAVVAVWRRWLPRSRVAVLEKLRLGRYRDFAPRLFRRVVRLNAVQWQDLVPVLHAYAWLKNPFAEIGQKRKAGSLD